MTQIPESFFKQMEILLGSEFSRFRESFKQEPVSGLRVNTLKISVDEFIEKSPFGLERIPGITTGFLVHPKDQPGKHPYHAAGLYYLQEPSAMIVGGLAAPSPGENVIDLCAAPGGKVTHLATTLQGEGWLLANEIHRERVWELVENLERWGAANACIANETPQRLAAHFGSFFDRVLVDAPCSGEGMFRRSETARREWSPAFVESCALRQSGILVDAARLVKPGGALIYSTCTFAPEENEGVIASFLESHPEFHMKPLPPFPGASTGHPEWAGSRDELSLSLRFWPHRSNWDGHFIAALQKSENARLEAGKSWHPTEPAKANFVMMKEVLNPGLLHRWEHKGSHIFPRPGNRQDEHLFLADVHFPEIGALRLPRPGLWLGTVKKGKASAPARHVRFEPSHALALAIHKQDAVQNIDFPGDSNEIKAFLRGETLHYPGDDGWVLVCVDGFPLGWGKRHNSTIKNHYPRGLRSV